jgi:hypothetical protein
MAITNQVISSISDKEIPRAKVIKIIYKPIRIRYLAVQLYLKSLIVLLYTVIKTA